jgi:hypothetical protein
VIFVWSKTLQRFPLGVLARLPSRDERFHTLLEMKSQFGVGFVVDRSAFAEIEAKGASHAIRE